MNEDNIGFDAGKGPVGLPGAVQDAPLSEVAYAAGRPRVDPADPVTQFEWHAKSVIENLKLPEHNRMMALPKLAELVFWMRCVKRD